MTAVAAAPRVDRPSRGAVHIAAPALISIAALVVLSLIVAWGWGQPARFGSVDAYRRVMDAAVILRLGPAFFSAVIVYPVMRLRGASIAVAGLGAVSSAVAFGVIGAVGALTFFPPLQAAYYAINPMAVAAIGSQIAWSAVGETFVRWRRDRSALRSWRFWAVIVAIALAGFALCYIGVIWDGGRHWFYVWMRGFMLMFGTGQ